MAPPGGGSPEPRPRTHPDRHDGPGRGRVENPVHFAEREDSSLVGRLGRQPGAALGSPALDDRAARPRFHPGTKTVLTLAPPVIWLKGSLGHGCSPNLSRIVPPWTPSKQVANLRGTIGVSQEYSGFAFVHVKGISRGREGVFHMPLDSRPSALRRIRFGFIHRATSLILRDFPPALSGGVTPQLGGQTRLSTLVDIPVDYRGETPSAYLPCFGMVRCPLDRERRRRLIRGRKSCGKPRTNKGEARDDAFRGPRPRNGPGRTGGGRRGR
jgi:hypothetical protein